MPLYTIEFQPVGRRGQCRDDQSITDCARTLGIGINSICALSFTVASIAPLVDATERFVNFVARVTQIENEPKKH